MARWKKTYVARKGSPINDAAAQLVGSMLDSIERNGGDRTGENLLDHSRDPSSPTHLLFQWDDAIAAESHRLEKARELVACVKVVMVDGTPEKAFHSVRWSKRNVPVREYRSRVEILSDDDSLMQVSSRLYRTLMAAVREADSLGLGRKDNGWRSLISACKKHAPGNGWK